MSSAHRTQTTWQHEQESVESLTRRAHELIALQGVKFSPSKVSRLIRKRQNDRLNATPVDFDKWFMTSYSDPTGEIAAHRLACTNVNCPACTEAPSMSRTATPAERRISFGGDR